jgi:hypothetical protein
VPPWAQRIWSLVRQLQAALGGNRVLAGTVVGTATPSITVTAGSGFTVVRNGVGDYSVTFDTPFAAAPAVSLGAGQNAVFYAVKISAAGPVSATGFRAFLWVTNTLAATDGEFHFVAVGP